MKWISVKERDKSPKNKRIFIYSPVYEGKNEDMLYRIIDSQFLYTCKEATHFMIPEKPNE